MPKYFFDIDENGLFSRDEVGVELPDLGTAMVQAKITLPAMAQEALRQNEALTVRSTVRDEDGDLVFEAILQMQTKLFS